QEENIGKFNAFFRAVLEQLDRRGPTLLVVEYEPVAGRLKTLQNGYLEFDHIAIGNRTYLPENLPNVRLVRVSSDHKKQPYYHHDTGNKWTSGFFSWGGAKRTFYGLKSKSPSVSAEQNFAS